MLLLLLRLCCCCCCCCCAAAAVSAVSGVGGEDVYITSKPLKPSLAQRRSFFSRNRIPSTPSSYSGATLIAGCDNFSSSLDRTTRNRIRFMPRPSPIAPFSSLSADSRLAINSVSAPFPLPHHCYVSTTPHRPRRDRHQFLYFLDPTAPFSLAVVDRRP